jgi:ribonucleoside-triphosphate reductase
MAIKKYVLFSTPMCPKCPKIKEFMKDKDIESEFVDAATREGLEKARKLKVTSVPTVIFFDQDDKEVSRATSIEEVKRVIENRTLSDV